MSQVREQIKLILKENQWLDVNAIQFGFSFATDSTEIKQELNHLLNLGQVQKKKLTSKHALWRLSNDESKTEMIRLPIEQRLLNLLEERKVPVSALECSRSLELPKSEINKILYKLKAKKITTSIEPKDGCSSLPKWMLTNHEKQPLTLENLLMRIEKIESILKI